ncbi:MAG: hypothetical protein ACI8PZ_002846 [Myxococcota bacterium]|jgi:hypothetical protein
MAEVFLATERTTGGDRLAVVKRMRPQLAADPRHREMFAQEAALAGRLHHPNIVTLHSADIHDGHPFIIMEYVDGVSLRELLLTGGAKGRPLPVDVVVNLLAQACAGAHAAHELSDGGGPMGLVHRDLTPHNLMVTDTGTLKILDFGIAHMGTDESDDDPNILKGKARYLAPEQVRGTPVDRRTDVFTLGVVAFELLTGVRPFDRESEADTFAAIAAGKPADLQELRPELTLDLVAAIERAIAPDLADRFATAADFAASLREAFGGPVDRDRTARLVRDRVGATLAGRRIVVERALTGSLHPLGRFDAFRAADTEAEELEPDPTDSEVRELNANIEPQGPPPTAWAQPFAAGGVGGLVAALVVALLASPAPTPSGTIEVWTSGDPSLGRQAVVAHLTATLDRPVVLVQSRGELAAEALATGRADIAVLQPSVARAAAAAAPEAFVLAVERRGGRDRHDAVLLGQHPTIAEHAGASLCHLQSRSDVSYHLPRAALAAAGLDPDLDVDHRFLADEEAVLRDLVTGRCGLGAVHEAAAHRAGADVIRVADLGAVPNDLWVVGPRLGRDTAKAIGAALNTFIPAPEVATDPLGLSGLTRLPER